MGYVEMEELVGLVFASVEQVDDGNGDELQFRTLDGQLYRMYHMQDCCESVYLDDIVGDLEDLVGSPILIAREAVSENRTDAERDILNGEEYVMHKLATFGEPRPVIDESQTWTFYLFSTNKGSVTLRWYGTSNGYYSESVYIFKD